MNSSSKGKEQELERQDRKKVRNSKKERFRNSRSKKGEGKEERMRVK